MCDVGFMA
ncbi:hypothetical protein RDI58_025184 [Solanum bulbocastanum]|uniref:Uncharacterized protein n=1 Tax=Solanum bulbocastanum TaxID=147425 RepID=A0AAN8Y4C4_SOLBU